jgi:hypothetical protein
VNPNSIAPWGIDWAWGLPLIALTVMLHVTGLGLLRRLGDHFRGLLARYPGGCVAGVALLVVLLHGTEAAIWAWAFRSLGGLPDIRSAALYSLNALTSYGHTDLTLERKWQMMGALEALNGWILFGLSAAFLFTLIQSVWSHQERPTRAASGFTRPEFENDRSRRK